MVTINNLLSFKQNNPAGFMPAKTTTLKPRKKSMRRLKDMDFSADFEIGRTATLETRFRGIHPTVVDIMNRWGRSCGDDEAELLALAVGHVLGEKLGINQVIHRDGRVGKNQLRLAHHPLTVAKRLAKEYRLPAELIWRDACRWVARQYSYTQAFIRNHSYNDEFMKVCRGVTGSVAETIKGMQPGDTADTRTLESWCTDIGEATRFARRNGDGFVIETMMPVERILGIDQTCDALNRSECEVLTINPTGKIIRDDFDIVDIEKKPSHDTW